MQSEITFLVKSSVPTKRRCTIEENALGVDMYWYNSLEKELDHVQNALQILGGKRDQFPPGTVVGNPKYWSTRLKDIRERAERNNQKPLKARADELLAEVEKLQR